MAGTFSKSSSEQFSCGISDTISELSDARSTPEFIDVDGSEDSDKTSNDDAMPEVNTNWDKGSNSSDRDVELGYDFMNTDLDGSGGETDDTELDESDGVVDDETPHRKLSSFESIPTEIVQNIAIRVNTDQDLGSLIATSSILHSILRSNNQNCIWRQRFLARYDYPFVGTTSDFSFAYKLRTLVLRNFDGKALEHGLKRRCGHQLDVIKDMILETYNPSSPCGSSPPHSRNMSLFSESNSPEWLVKLLGCAAFGSERTKYGRPNLLFDMIQVTLSHLVLAQRSPVLARIQSSRFNYDLLKVYNFNLPFATILEASKDEREEVSPPARSTMFPNLISPPVTPEPGEPQYKLNMHALLHIRNFWQRHFTQNIHGIGENTYAAMIRSLSMSGVEPREWDQPLSNWTPFNKTWYGHYSCIHPWPKSREELEECQSCAEDWNSIDPMLLDLETSTTNEQNMYWPGIFNSISALADAMPHVAFAKDYNLTYLRGIAPFTEIERSISMAEDSTGELQKWHPFLASRVNGFVHDIPNEALLDEHAQERRADDFGDDEDQPIPGWKHICMVIWKPTTQHLLAVLDHAEENYGGASGIQISADFNTANIWNDQDSNLASTSPAVDVLTTQDTGLPASANTTTTTTTTNNAATTTQPTEAEIEAQMKILLTQRIKSFAKKYTALRTTQAEKQSTGVPTHKPDNSTSEPQRETLLPPLFSAQHIRQLEESFSQAQYLAWDDGTIDYAYTYEGIIIPGGKIMMGRWWRTHGIEGLGPGQEVGVDGVGVEVRPVQSEPASNSMDADADADGETTDGGKKGKGKAKVKNAGKKKARVGKRLSRRGKKRKAREVDSDEEFLDSEEEVAEEPRIEYEFVTVVNGEESRAVNGCKGLERGPFVFWAA